MKTENISLVKRIYEEFGKGNIPGVLERLSDHATWIDPGYPDIPYAGKRQGLKEIGAFFGEMNAHVEFSRFEPKSFHEDEGTVFVTGFFAGRSRSTGKSFESEWAMVWRIEAGKVAFYQAYVDTHNLVRALKS
jgi:uncharacterized protein